MEEWDLISIIKALVMDTTGSSTGVLKGCAVRILKHFKVILFFFGCRHHWTELIAKDLWYKLFDVDLSPECAFFNSIKLRWEEMDTSGQTPLRQIDVMELAELEEWREESIIFYKDILSRRDKKDEVATRDDYRELAESALYLLGGIKSKFWRKPGASHKARFCAFGIYAMRAFAFGDQLDLDEEMLESLGRFCQFLTTV